MWLQSISFFHYCFESLHKLLCLTIHLICHGATLIRDVFHSTSQISVVVSIVCLAVVYFALVLPQAIWSTNPLGPTTFDLEMVRQNECVLIAMVLLLLLVGVKVLLALHGGAFDIRHTVEKFVRCFR